MKNFILKHKMILLIFLFLTLLFINNNVFATDDVVSYTDRFGTTRSIVTPPIDVSYGYIIKGNFLFIFNDSDTYGYIKVSGGSNESFYLSGSWTLYTLSDNNTKISNSVVGSGDSARLAVLSEVLYTSVDIYKGIDKSSIALSASPNFFPVAPPEEETPETPEEIPQEMATLPEIMEQVEKGEVLKEIVALLPVILSVLVSLLALRKALQMLLNFLRVS